MPLTNPVLPTPPKKFLSSESGLAGKEVGSRNIEFGIIGCEAFVWLVSSVPERLGRSELVGGEDNKEGEVVLFQ